MNSFKKILLLGYTGQLGCVLRKINFQNCKLLLKSSKDINFLHKSTIYRKLSKINPSLIINCSAYTDVDGAEINKKECNLINNIAVKYIADFCRDKNIFLIHFSTDYIFNNKKKIPINENEIHKPLNYYGKTKSKSEKKIINSKCKYIILRMGWVYSEYGKNFIKKIINLLKSSDVIRVVNDQTGSPTSLYLVKKIVKKIVSLILSKKINNSHIFNVSNRGSTTWFKFAKKIEKIYFNNNNGKILKTTSAKFKTKASRPSYSKLSNNKISLFLKLNIENWEVDLEKFLKKKKLKI